MATALEIIKKLKTEAKNWRDRGRYGRAIETLEEAIPFAQKAKDESGVFERKVFTAELADCYGIKGGVYRRWALETTSPTERSDYLSKSLLAYKDGYRLDTDPDYGGASSYNMLNRLITMIFIKPGSLSSSQQEEIDSAKPSLNLRRELEKTREFIEKNSAQNDYWAKADLALLDLLLNDADPIRAYASFNAERPPDFAYESALSVLGPLSRLDLPMASQLKKAVILLEKERAKLATT